MTRWSWGARRGTAWWSTGRRGAGTGSGPLGDLIEVFQPTRRHVVEEQERRRDHVQAPGSGAPPLVDLDAGTVVLPTEGAPPLAGPVGTARAAAGAAGDGADRADGADGAAGADTADGVDGPVHGPPRVSG